MKIQGWIATNKQGLILGSFHENQEGAIAAARQILRLTGGPSLVAGFRLIQATLTVQDMDDTALGQEAEAK